jgi:hypothetical protein
MLGDNAVCEHVGIYQSSELSRFRHSKRKYRICPLCGYQNGITAERYCEKTLYLIEYLNTPDLEEPAGEGEQPIPPSPGGHGGRGPSGHYVGRCLCSPIGCNGPCNGYINPLFGYHFGFNMVNPYFAIIASEHVCGWAPGRELTVGQTVFVTHADPVIAVPGPAGEGGVPTMSPAPSNILWKDGRLGGQAVIRAWRRCGGNNLTVSWHGNNVLCRQSWKIEEEDTMVLLLQQDGSTGLDLSFATHIFLLERVTDPALRNQIISRAHRVGATGPVSVQLLQVVAEGEDTIPESKLSHPLVQPSLRDGGNEEGDLYWAPE